MTSITAEAARAKAAELYLNQELFTLTQASNSGVAGEKTRAEAVEAGLQTQISNLLSNTDETALNSLAEIVQDYTDNGVTVTAALAAQALKQENERIASDARIAVIEALLEQLQATVQRLQSETAVNASPTGAAEAVEAESQDDGTKAELKEILKS